MSLYRNRYRSVARRGGVGNTLLTGAAVGVGAIGAYYGLGMVWSIAASAAALAFKGVILGGVAYGGYKLYQLGKRLLS